MTEDAKPDPTPAPAPIEDAPAIQRRPQGAGCRCGGVIYIDDRTDPVIRESVRRFLERQAN